MFGSPTSAHLPGARRNGILTQIHRFLNTLGSWDSYRDLARPEDIPGRLARITTTFFGLGLDQTGLPRASGILGAIMAVHALEQVTGSLATFGLRLLVRGEPRREAGHLVNGPGRMFSGQARFFCKPCLISGAAAPERIPDV